MHYRRLLIIIIVVILFGVGFKVLNHNTHKKAVAAYQRSYQRAQQSTQQGQKLGSNAQNQQ